MTPQQPAEKSDRPTADSSPYVYNNMFTPHTADNAGHSSSRQSGEKQVSNITLVFGTPEKLRLVALVTLFIEV